ncbi:hypothetical protein KBB89_00970 [Candidatus Gracilibacteria bacterium]|nr:hypothetical protein [Candidatus Gracilibacteria bacterium]
MHYFLKNIKHFAPHILLCGLILMINTSWAAGVTGIGNGTSSTRNLEQNSLFRPGSGDLVGAVRNVALDIIHALRIILNGVALLAMLYVGFLWVSSMGSEEKRSDGTYRILLIVIGLFLINVAELLYNIITGSSYLSIGFSRKVGSVSTRDPGGEFSQSALETCNYFFCPQNFWGNGNIVAIVKFFEMAMIGTAVVMFTWGGFTMLTAGNNESTSKTAKMRIVYGMIALIVVGFIESIYRAIFFGRTMNATGIMSVLVTIANFFIFLAGPIAILFIILGSYYYITAAGNEERADKGKKIILYTFFATILLILSYTFLVEIVGLNLF